MLRGKDGWGAGRTACLAGARDGAEAATRVRRATKGRPEAQRTTARCDAFTDKEQALKKQDQASDAGARGGKTLQGRRIASPSATRRVQLDEDPFPWHALLVQLPPRTGDAVSRRRPIRPASSVVRRRAAIFLEAASPAGDVNIPTGLCMRRHASSIPCISCCCRRRPDRAAVTANSMPRSRRR